MKAITTKYHGPTNTKGSRVSATDSDGNKVIVSYDSSLDSENAHAQAVVKLCKNMNWHGALIVGSIKSGYVFVWKKGAGVLSV